ncbi:MAG: insulinase family protein [Ruminococcus sp.]|nr:insulinase family protein [Ruminococcus sp.]
MSVQYERKDLGGGIHFSVILDKRYKTNFFSVRLITKLSPETASANSIIPSILSKSCESHPSQTEFNRMLTALYGSTVYDGCGKLGDHQILSVNGTAIGDRYALEGESICGQLIDIILECVTKPALENGVFPEKEFELKRRELIDDILTEINDKRSYAFMQTSKIVYDGEPAAYSVNGTLETAKALTSASVYEQYRRLISEAQIEVIFAGGEYPEGAEEKIIGAFKPAERNVPSEIVIAPSPIKQQPVSSEDKLDVVQCKMILAYKYKSENEPAVRLLNMVLGATPVSKLFTNVREKLSLCYYCSSSVNLLKKTLFVDSGVSLDKVEAAKAEINRQIEEIKAGNVTESELSAAKLAISNSAKAYYDYPKALAGWYFNNSLRGISDDPEEIAAKVCAVTMEELKEAAASLVPDTEYLLRGLEESAGEDE